MKLYFLIGLIVIVLAVLVLSTPNNLSGDEDVSTQTFSSDGSLVVDSSTLNTNSVDKNSDVLYSVFLRDDVFSPAVLYANKGDKIILTFNNGKLTPEKLEVLYDFNIPEFGISTVVDTAQQIEFVANKKGEFDYFCLTCSPQVKGLLIVN